MSLSPARPAALLNARSPSDATTLLPLNRRYTCGLTDVDCGNGYCCSAAHECVQQSGQTLCRLPGFLSADQTAEPASDAAAAAAAAATSSASQTVCMSGSSTSDCVALGADGTASSSSGSSGLSAGAIAGIVVGVVAALAVVVGAVVFCLCARRRRKRREDVVAAGRKEAGGGGYATQMPLGYQPVGGGDGLVDMYGGSNVGKMQGRVSGKAEVMGDTTLPPAVQELPGSEVGRPVELDAGTEKK